MASTRSSGPSLLDLPLEIQRRIVAELADATSFRSVHALLYTCKQWYTIALPFSVRTFWEGHLAYSKDRQPRRRSRSLDFLCYITITKPELAQYVDTIIMGKCSTKAENEHLDCDLGQPTEAERSLFEDSIHKTFPAGSADFDEARAEWLAALDQQLQDAELALLLVVCPRLRALYLGDPPEPEITLRVLKEAGAPYHGPAQRKPFLTKLENFHHESPESKYGYLGFDHFATAVLQIPSIRSYECIMPNGPDDVEAGPIARSSSLESMVLRMASLTAATLHALVGACKCLRTFEYLYYPVHMYDVEATPRDFLEALLPHAGTLESMYIDSDESWEKVGWDETPTKTFMGHELRQMIRLKKLVVGSQSLTGLLSDSQRLQCDPLELADAPRISECIPQQLEHLTIHSCGKPILPQLRELLESLNKPDHFPQMKSVRFLFDEDSISPSDLADLASGRNNVQLELVIQSAENRSYDLIASDGQSDAWVCSPIYSPHARSIWLKYRGQNKGRANKSRVVIEAPSS